ncbi:MAG: hypothetical protein P4L46_00115 [Fimbriimonas sp.]|nr:hypothetical protein [Fimbriimonas sp.]
MNSYRGVKTLRSGIASKVLLQRGSILLIMILSLVSIQGCGNSPKAETQSKASSDFYKHTDSKSDPFLQKKDD